MPWWPRVYMRVCIYIYIYYARTYVAQILMGSILILATIYIWHVFIQRDILIMGLKLLGLVVPLCETSFLSASQFGNSRKYEPKWFWSLITNTIGGRGWKKKNKNKTKTNNNNTPEKIKSRFAAFKKYKSDNLTPCLDKTFCSFFFWLFWIVWRII